jgi:hypothetical protein
MRKKTGDPFPTAGNLNSLQSAPRFVALFSVMPGAASLITSAKNWKFAKLTRERTGRNWKTRRQRSLATIHTQGQQNKRSKAQEIC